MSTILRLPDNINCVTVSLVILHGISMQQTDRQTDGQKHHSSVVICIAVDVNVMTAEKANAAAVHQTQDCHQQNCIRTKHQSKNALNLKRDLLVIS